MADESLKTIKQKLTEFNKLVKQGKELTAVQEQELRTLRAQKEELSSISGWIYYKLEDLEKAQKFLEASLEIIYDNAVVLEHLGDLMMKGNKSKDARNYYLRALELDKNNPTLIRKTSPE